MRITLRIKKMNADTLALRQYDEYIYCSTDIRHWPLAIRYYATEAGQMWLKSAADTLR